jgi:hypothetical protein
MTMRRPSMGIRLLVTHRESMTQLLVIVTRDDGSGPAAAGCTSSWQASSCSVPLTRSRPTARQPPGTPGQQVRPESDLREGLGVQEAGAGQQPVQRRRPGADRARPRGQQCRRLLDWLADDGPAGQRQAALHQVPGHPRVERRAGVRGINPPGPAGQPRPL